MNKVKLVSALVALTLGMFFGSAFSAEEQKPIKSQDPAASEVTDRSTPPDASGGSEVKSQDPAASEVTGRSTPPDASGGSEVKSQDPAASEVTGRSTPPDAAGDRTTMNPDSSAEDNSVKDGTARAEEEYSAAIKQCEAANPSDKDRCINTVKERFGRM